MKKKMKNKGNKQFIQTNKSKQNKKTEKTEEDAYIFLEKKLCTTYT